jgi:hypothetical protein
MQKSKSSLTLLKATIIFQELDSDKVVVLFQQQEWKQRYKIKIIHHCHGMFNVLVNKEYNLDDRQLTALPVELLPVHPTFLLFENIRSSYYSDSFHYSKAFPVHTLHF